MSTETPSAPRADAGRGPVAVPRVPLWVLVACVAGLVAFLAAVWIGSEVLGRPLLVFLVEPASIGSDLWYAGVVSTTGALLWWSVATVSYVTAWIARATGTAHAGFWLGLAVFTTVLTIDDLYQGHEYLYPTFLHLSEEVSATIYALTAAALLLGYRSYVRTLPWHIGLTALVFFAISEAIDFLYVEGDNWQEVLFAEEGTKLAGIAALTLFVVWSSQSVLLRARAQDTA